MDLIYLPIILLILLIPLILVLGYQTLEEQKHLEQTIPTLNCKQLFLLGISKNFIFDGRAGITFDNQYLEKLFQNRVEELKCYE